MTEEETELRQDDGSRRTTALHLAVILAGCLVTIVPNISTRDLWEPEELRYTEVAREMVERGDWALLTLNYKKYPDKPPLFFWAIAVSTKCFGGMKAWSVRLVNIVSSVLCVLAVYLFGRRLTGPRPAFIGTLVLLTTPFFIWTCAEARMDSMLTLFIVLSLWAFWRNYEKGGRSIAWALAFGIFGGLGTLTKGPIGVILPFLAAASFAVVDRNPRRVFNLRFFSFLIPVALLVLPWLALACHRGGPEFRHEILFLQNVGRYCLKWKHPRPFYHHFLALPMLLAPWTALIPAMFYNPIARRDEKKRRSLNFLLCWFLSILVFFSFCRGKRDIYMIPLIPAAALLMGCAFDAFLSSKKSGERYRMVGWGFAIVLACTLIFSLLAPLFPLAVKAGTLQSLVPKVKFMERPDVFTSPGFIRGAFAASAVFGVGIIISAGLYARRRWTAALGCFMAGVAAAWLVGSLMILPSINQQKSARVMLQSLRAIVHPSQPLASYKSERLAYSVYWPAKITPITKREEFLKYLARPERVFSFAPWFIDGENGPRLFYNDWPLLEERMAFNIWRGRCGARTHLLLSNTLPIDNVQEARDFLKESSDYYCTEAANSVFLMYGCRGETYAADSIALDIRKDAPIIRVYPKVNVERVIVTIDLKGLDPDKNDISIRSMRGGKEEIEYSVKPIKEGTRLRFTLRVPCEIKITPKAEPKAGPKK